MSDSVECPHCGETITDLWEYNWDPVETTETDCDHCGKPIVIVRHVSVSYSCEPVGVGDADDVSVPET